MRARAADMVRAVNDASWAIGTPRSNGFHVRKIVWGFLMAQYERRDEEEIRAAMIMVEPTHKRRRKRGI